MDDFGDVAESEILCASRNPTSPTPQSTSGSFNKKNSSKKYQNYKPHGTQIVTRNFRNGPQKPPKWRPKPSKIEPKLDQEGARTTKKSKNNIDPTKRGAACHRAPPFWRKMWPTWPQLGSQDGAKIDNKSLQKSIKKMMPSKIDFWSDFGGFLERQMEAC